MDPLIVLVLSMLLIGSTIPKVLVLRHATGLPLIVVHNDSKLRIVEIFKAFRSEQKDDYRHGSIRKRILALTVVALIKDVLICQPIVSLLIILTLSLDSIIEVIYDVMIIKLEVRMVCEIIKHRIYRIKKRIY